MLNLLLKGGFYLLKSNEGIELMKKRGIQKLEEWLEEELKKEEEQNEKNENQK